MTTAAEMMQSVRDRTNQQNVQNPSDQELLGYVNEGYLALYDRYILNDMWKVSNVQFNVSSAMTGSTPGQVGFYL